MCENSVPPRDLLQRGSDFLGHAHVLSETAWLEVSPSTGRDDAVGTKNRGKMMWLKEEMWDQRIRT